MLIMKFQAIMLVFKLLAIFTRINTLTHLTIALNMSLITDILLTIQICMLIGNMMSVMLGIISIIQSINFKVILIDMTIHRWKMVVIHLHLR